MFDATSKDSLQWMNASMDKKKIRNRQFNSMSYLREEGYLFTYLLFINNIYIAFEDFFFFAKDYLF